MKLSVKMTLVLVLSSLGAAALLGLVFGVTAPLIEEQKKKAKAQALDSLLPEADTFIALNVIEGKDTSVIYLAYKKDAKVGLVFTTAPKGYGGPVETMVGVRKDSSIAGIRIASAAEGLKETPGLGSRVLEDTFRNQFKGLRMGEVYLKKDGGKVQAITAATISSKAVTSGIRMGLERYLPYLSDAPKGTAPADSTGAPQDTTVRDTVSARPQTVDKVVVANGFIGDFKVVVKLTPQGKIASVHIPSKDFPETEGYGTRCLEESFLSRFVGLSTSEEVAKVQAVSGATRTSDSIKVAVAKAFGK